MEKCFFLIGVLGFVLFALADINDAFIRAARLRLLFPLGAVLLAGASTALVFFRPVPRLAAPLAILLGCLCAVFLLLLIYSLFFALSAGQAYTMPGQPRPVNTRGVYALCRHPGVLWFIALFACLCVWPGFPVYAAAVYCGLNVLLALFEDVLIFPRILTGYLAYRRTTPFLIPNKRSIKQALTTYKYKGGAT